MGKANIPVQKCIALVAHDKRKDELIAWVKQHLKELQKHKLCGTGTTSSLIAKKLNLKIKKFKSGPIGGDQQIGAQIVEGRINCLIFFWDPLEAQPHDPDVKALLRLATMWNIPIACNQTTADFILSSPWMGKNYERDLTHLEEYKKGRMLPTI